MFLPRLTSCIVGFLLSSCAGINSGLTFHGDHYRVTMPKQREVAVHEAGHALVHAALHGPAVIKAVVVRTRCCSDEKDMYVGVTRIHTEELLLRTVREHREQIEIFVAGAVAERLVFGASDPDGTHDDDHAEARAVTVALCASPEYRSRLAGSDDVKTSVTKELAHADRRVAAFLAANKPTLLALADRLMSIPPKDGARTMDGSAFKAFMAGVTLRPFPARQ